MLIFFALYVVVVLWGVKFRTKSTNEYLDMEHTQSVKGIFILLVLFSHFNPQVTFAVPLDLKYKEIISFLVRQW